MTDCHIETGESVTSKEYVFDGIEGIRFFAPRINDESGAYTNACADADEGIADIHVHINATDEGETISINGTIYVAAHKNFVRLYLNPVYQSPDGEVYAVSGDGIIFDEVPGASRSQKITENITSTYGDTKTSSGTEVEVTVCVMNEPTNITLLQFNSNNELLSQNEYAPGNLPDHINTFSDTQYIIVETASSDGLSRALFQQEDAFIDVFYCRDDGICVKHGYEVKWND